MNFAFQVQFSVICIYSLSKLGRSEQYFMFQFCVLSLFNSLSKNFQLSQIAVFKGVLKNKNRGDSIQLSNHNCETTIKK